MVGIRNRFDLMMNYLIKTNWNSLKSLIVYNRGMSDWLPDTK
jgi:hypothetical protein